MNPQVAWFVPGVAIVGVFTWLSVNVWVDGRRKEREAFYKAETIRRITEASGEGAKAAIELMREDSRMERIKKYEGLKLGGLICIAAGIGLTILFLTLEGTRSNSPYMVGLIPGLIGVALLIYVYVLAGHWEQGPKD